MNEERSSAPRRVLVAEDTESIGHLLVHILSEAGYEVRLAGDGQECLEQAKEFRPDLIVLDLMMPKLHGIEVMRRLKEREQTRDIPVIVCSAKPFKTEQVAAAELGAVAFRTKPIDPNLLLQTVAEVFEAGREEVDEDGGDATAPFGVAYEPVLHTAGSRLAFWGTRGSIPTSGGRFLRHGGNTSCFEIRRGDQTIVFDAGSGIRELGTELVEGGPKRVHLFITHTHWDHIQGFPFFTPAFVPDFEITVYGARGFGKSLEAVFRGQLDQDYFPVQMEDMKATLDFRHLDEKPLRVAGVDVYWEYAQHPGATVGYKVELDGTTVTWLPDDEFLMGYVGPPDEITLEHHLVEPYRAIVDFLSGVDVLVHEAQYTNEEYRKKIGWGHSSVSNAALLAKLAGVGRWIVTHHDPSHDDSFLERKLNMTRQELARLGHDIPVMHGYDGLVEYL